MKKNFISKLLMAALVVVTMGVFSSCKDYDDDINANTALINQLQSQVKALEEARTSLESQLAAANKAIEKAQGDATSALSQIDQAKKELSDAIAKGDAANAQEIQKLSDRINTLESDLKQYASDQAAAAVEAAVTKYQLAEVANLITKVQELDKAMADRYTKTEIDDMLTNYVKSEDFKTAVQSINKEITDLRNDLKANADADKIVADKLDEIYSRAIKDGDIDKAIAAVASDLSSFKEGINKIINEDEAKENAGFATLTALKAANKQIEANKEAIEKLQDWTTNFDTNVLPTLATVEALNQAIADLKTLIDKKADKTALDEAVNTINETIKTLATKTEVTTQIEAAVKEIKDLLAKDYVTNDALEGALTKLSGEITLAYKTYTDDQLKAFKGELAGIIKTAIDANNTTLKQEIYGEVDSKIGKALANYVTNTDLATKLAQYTTTQSLMTILADYAKKADVTAEINKFYNEKLADKMAEIEAISAQLASMDQAFVDLAEELAALDDFEVEEEASAGRQASSATSAITALKNLLTVMSNKIVNIHLFVEQSIQNVNEKLDVFVKFTNKNITSLVTVPDEWLYGLPKINATIVQAQETYTFNFVNGTDVVTTSGRTLSGAAPKLKANYWLNPSVADWKEYTYTFNEVAAQSWITRGNEDKEKAGFMDIDTENDVTFKDGVLTVEFQFKNPANVNNALTHYDTAYLTDGTKTDGEWNEHWVSQGNNPGYSQNPSYAWTTTIALQAKRNNTEDETALGLTDNRVVTSDYAIVAPSYITNLVLANTGNFVDKTEYKDDDIEADEHGVKGNHHWHIFTSFGECVAQNATGVYTYEVERDDVNAYDLNNFIETHVFDVTSGDEESAQWDYATVTKNDFDYKYTLLTNTNVWNLDGSKISIKEGQGLSANTGNAKAGIIRVELVSKSNGKTFAYGYVSILMKNKEADLEIEIPELVLKCVPLTGQAEGYEDFQATYDWDELIDSINDKLGQNIDWKLANFVVAEMPKARANAEAAATPNVGPYKKFKNKNTDDADTETLGTLFHDEEGETLTWSFSHSEVIDAFYLDDEITPANTTNYSVLIKIAPTDAGVEQGVAPMWITVKILKVIYPSGSFNDPATQTSDRITSNWFKQYSNEKTTDGTLRYEIHVNDEAPGETDANNEIKYDVTSAFVGNKFKFTGDKGFENIPNEADLFFNQARYFIFDGTNGTKWDKDADYILNGAHGNQYVMYLHDPDIDDDETAPYTVLYAALITNGVANFNAATDTVAVLTGDHNEIVTFKDFDNAKDLLNHARHDQLGKDETFTSHMIMHVSEYCLPVDERGNNTFDIRYLRPISANVAGQKKVYDAKDDGNKIYVADLVSFIDWRKHEFAASNATVKVPAGQPSTNWTGYQYMAYYGITTIKADFDKARSNVHVGQLSDILDADGNIVKPEAWPTIKEITGKINFYPDENAEAINAGGTADENSDWTEDYSGFRAANGYYTYENNSGGTTDFYIILPVSVVYFWGETQPEWILIEVKGTEGQGNHARQF